MKKGLFSRLLFIGVLVFGFLGNDVTPAFANSLAKNPLRIHTFIILNELRDVNLGETILISGTVKDAYDRPVAEKSILFTIEGKYLGQARSDENGNFERTIKNRMDAGMYEITATSNATRYLASTSSSTTLKVQPATLQVQTVPAIEGVHFELNGRRFISGADGSASIKVEKIGQYQLHVLAEEYKNPTQRIEFGRWLQESFEPYLMIEVPNDDIIQVGLNVFHLVGQSFLDLDGNLVDSERISTFTIRSIQGDVFEFTDGQPRWIPASRTARRITGLEETQLLYSVIEVMVDGSNVVNRSQQRFYAEPGFQNWEISLLFYSMRVNAQDGLFGFPVGSSVNLEFPDGSLKNYPLDENGVAEISSLSRGNYSIEFVGTNGLSNRTPVALSRNQDVHTKVITYLDIATVGLLGIIFALGILFYGRPWFLSALTRKKRPFPQEPAHAPDVAMLKTNPINGIIRHETAMLLSDEQFKQLTGISHESFNNILTTLQDRWGDRGKNAKLTRGDQLLITLIESKGEKTKAQIGLDFGISETTVYRTVKKVKATLVRLKELELLNNEMFQNKEITIDNFSLETLVAPMYHLEEAIHDN